MRGEPYSLNAGTQSCWYSAIIVDGNITNSTIERDFNTRIMSYVNPCKDVVLDLTRIESFDGSAFASIVRVLSEIKGDLVIVSNSMPVINTCNVFGREFMERKQGGRRIFICGSMDEIRALYGEDHSISQIREVA